MTNGTLTQNHGVTITGIDEDILEIASSELNCAPCACVAVMASSQRRSSRQQRTVDAMG
jgi:hypothetical protein